MIGALAAPYHAVKGAWRSPPEQQIKGAIRLVRNRTPALMGGFAAWGLLMTSFDCSLEAIRGKKDPWNRILAMGAVRGTFAIRAGPRIALLRTIEGCLLFSAVEVIGIVTNKYFENQREATRSRSSDDMAPTRTFAKALDDDELTRTLPVGMVSITPVSCSDIDAGRDLTEAAHSRMIERYWPVALAVAIAARAAHRHSAPIAKATDSAIKRAKVVAANAQSRVQRR